MEVSASRTRLRLARRVHAALLLVSLVLGHQAVFSTQHGLGAQLARAMREGGHDGYWPFFAIVVLAAGGAMLGRALLRLQLLASQRRRAADTPARASRRDPGWATYLRGVAAIWCWLLPLTLLGFALLENVEHLLQHAHLIGLGALIGPEYPTALPVLFAVSLGLAALGALVRWRERLLLARPLRARHDARPSRTPDTPIPASWAVVAALCRRYWTGLPNVPRRGPPLPAVLAASGR